MNDRHNRIAGCQAAVDAARVQVDVAARELANGFTEWQDSCADTLHEVQRVANEYRKAQESYASALDDLADALRR